MTWTDWGGRLGVASDIEVSPNLGVGLGGYVGVARRDVSFSGIDVTQGPNATPMQISNISTTADTTVFVANVEARIAIRLKTRIAFQVFGGANYNNNVPGIRKPGWTGEGGGPSSTTAAGIKFETEMSWYAGGGLIATFSP